jgi:hypothetical protein
LIEGKRKEKNPNYKILEIKEFLKLVVKVFLTVTQRAIDYQPLITEGEITARNLR